MTDDDPWIKAERAHEREMAAIAADERRRHRQAVTERVTVVAWAVGIVLVVAMLSTWGYLWQKESGERGQRIEQACITAGGSWASVNGGSKTCVRVEEAP